MPEGSVQRAHQRKKRARRVERNLKPFGLQLFTEHTKPVKAVDGRNVAPIALQPAQCGG
jgi:hypothetical protein